MGNNEEGKFCKSEKPSSPAPQDQTNIHVYPDWAAMQAYYGPRVALPPYYNSAMAPGHAPHPYMWGTPQPMMPPYGAPYAIYPHGGVYASPPVPIGSHAHGHGIPSSSVLATPLNIDTPTKSSENSDRGLIKKLKGFDGLTMSLGNGNDNAESDEGGECRPSKSEETEGSTDGSDGNTFGGRKRSREVTPTIGGDVKTEIRASSIPAREVNTSANISGKAAGTMDATGITTALELRNNPNVNAAKTSLTSAAQQCAVLPSEAWLQNERELKQERRKQSNRESARRSRLRKQAETEELARRVESLIAENVALKTEVSKLTEKSEKLRVENATLMEKLKTGQPGQIQEIILKKTDGKKVPSTENLLSRVNNSATIERSKGEEGESYKRNSNSGAKLHQLLDTSPRSDAVAAG